MEVIVQTNTKRKRKWTKITAWIVAIIIVLIAAIYFGANAYIARSLPKTEGEIHLSGLKEKVEIIRDKDGVPHIRAKNDHDLYMAQGYVQAQDRLFQMDLSRRQASGELSEVVGSAAIDKDKYFRALGLRRAAVASYDQYSNQAKDTLNWFAEGVNAFIKELDKNGKWPFEFKILGYKPKEWTPTDSLTIGKYMAFDLGGHWEDQAFRYYLLQNFSEEKAYDLFPSYPKDAPYIISKDTLNLEKSFASAVIPHEFNGSNNWVVSGEKTKSGKPILADDPHLSLSTPSIWYQMHLKGPDTNVSGVIFAGIPGIILGHNEEIAWGVTNTGPDVQDLYIEKRNPTNKNQFLYNEKWEDAEVIKEPIKVKDQKTIDYNVIVTRHGPIISEFAADSGKDTVLSLQWTALQPSNELEAILKMNRAKNWDEFETALENFQTPAQNFVFASNDGTIAYKANGKIPIRKKGDGLLPVPGWTDEYEWTGYIPFNKLPKTVNPKEGFISTANNKVISDDYPYHISHNWAQPYRQMRIQEVLKANDEITAKDMRDLQMDKMNLQAKEFVPIFLNELKGVKDKTEKEAIQQLKKWNFVDNEELAAPLIFNQWMAKISDVLFNKEISVEMLEKFGGRKQAVDELLRHAVDGNPGPWIKENGGLQAVLKKSFDLAINEIKDEQGNSVSKWSWGEFHQLYFPHPLSSVKPLNYLFNSDGRIPVGGSSVTVQAAANKNDGTVNHGGSWRFVIDTANMDSAYHLVGPGQSGHLKSQWYHNQLNAWANGTYHHTSLNTKKGHTLILNP
ncbi:penicillin acylase family protein [Heyndrickxia oleronia]|uniref:penicillin acylase family protein n=1 Tax=Heyndrickxia oleronia TaxID=38875 RepID=UPI00242F97C6|nr:penicillin acylase family protein [Heyndrickxia oleronia]MCI1590822.1 penicillin acylase family protein [Heyndrickxia oleronia]MCI1612821.1 penicillin acylase family protein [Heyndrickxia oleronia]MCI1744047.1 penicillin acylase family protein [Heyndrickxia oleronia]MCI1761670.1 penicillin acylase family protein [Heyndrickxia oleronia]